MIHLENANIGIDYEYNDMGNCIHEIYSNGYEVFNKFDDDFNRFMKDSIFGNKKIKFVEELDIEYFIRESISKFSLTSKAYSGLRTILKGTFRYAKQHGYTKISISNFFGDLQ